MDKGLELDLRIADLITKAERKEIQFDEFDNELKGLEVLKECTITV